MSVDAISPSAVDLVHPKVGDAWFWRDVKIQLSTTKFNPAQAVDLKKLETEISSSAKPLSSKPSAHRYYVRVEGEFAAVIALRAIDWSHGIAEVGYLVAEKFQGRGVATEGLRLLIEIAKEEPGLRKLRALTIEENVASHRVLEKNGFELEGRLKAEYVINGVVHDARVWGLLLR